MVKHAKHMGWVAQNVYMGTALLTGLRSAEQLAVAALAGVNPRSAAPARRAMQDTTVRIPTQLEASYRTFFRPLLAGELEHDLAVGARISGWAVPAEEDGPSLACFPRQWLFADSATIGSSQPVNIFADAPAKAMVRGGGRCERPGLCGPVRVP